MYWGFEYTVILSFLLKPIRQIPNSLAKSTAKLEHAETAIIIGIFAKKAFETIRNPVLVSPDAGAYKATHEIAEKLNADLVPSNKVRVDGIPQISIQGSVKGKNCLIVDDLADGGRTFKFLAEALKQQGALKVFLYVTHAQFNYGFEELKETINHVYCTNSYKDINDDFVTQFQLNISIN